jgi:AraC-like DNA-binding protein
LYFCADMTEWIVNHAEPLSGITRMQARFNLFAFSPHRHDTYAVGITTHGIQAFNYRGVSRGSGRGLSFVLHPDERHDGRAGTDDGFGYCIAYVSPGLIRDALAGAPLPFVRDPVSSDARLIGAIRELLVMTSVDSEIASVSAISGLAHAMRDLSGDQAMTSARRDQAALHRAEAVLRESSDRRISMAELEHHVGLSRWELARQFRMHFGVSLARFNLLRRLEQAQRMLQSGSSIVESAVACGFADQAHMTKAFKQAYGLTPGRWISLVGMVSR